MVVKISIWFEADASHDSWDLAALRRLPERIPVFIFHHDGLGLCGRLKAFEFIGADDRQRMTRVSKNPGHA